MPEADTPLFRLKQRYLNAVLSEETRLAGLVVEEGSKQGFGMLDIYLSILIPTQIDVGRAWYDGKISVAQEHLATQVTLNQMDRLRSQISPNSKLGFRVAVTTVEGESHSIGARMVADCFLADGWDVDFLGASTPGADLMEFVRRRGVDLVAISTTSEDCLPRLEWTVGSLATLPNPPKILLGGAAVRDTTDLAVHLGADALAHNLGDAILEGRRLIGLAKKPVSLADYLQSMGRKVQEIRKDLGWNQQQLADSADLDRTYISAVEHGKQNLTLGAIVKLADALGVELVQLLSQRDRR